MLDGPNGDGLFLVKWRGLEEPKWGPPQELRAVLKFQTYCEQHRLDKAGKPLPLPKGRGLRGAVVAGVGKAPVISGAGAVGGAAVAFAPV